MRLRDFALPAAVLGAFVIYLGTVWKGGLYVEAKAVAVPAALVMAFILGALLLRPEDVDETAAEPAEPEPDTPPTPTRRGARRRAAEPSGRPSLRTVIAVPFIVLAAYSSFLALRDAVVAPDDRFKELKALRDEVAGSSVLALTSDRYTDYYLRGAEVLSPAKNAEQKIPGRRGKEFRLPVDFDSVYASDLDDFDYVVTTDAEYQSGAPPNFEEVQRTDSYVLWKRNGVDALHRRPRRGLAAGADLPLQQPEVQAAAEPHRGRDHLAAAGDRQARDLGGRREDRAGRHRYADLRPAARQMGPLVPVLERVRAARGDGGRPDRRDAAGRRGRDPVPAERGAVLARRRDRLGRRPDRDRGQGEGALGDPEADRRGLAREPGQHHRDAPRGPGTLPFKASCRRYIDHYYLGAPGSLQGSKESGGGTLDLQPTR